MKRSLTCLALDQEFRVGRIAGLATHKHVTYGDLWTAMRHRGLNSQGGGLEKKDFLVGKGVQPAASV